MSSNNFLEYNDFQGVFTRKADNHIYEDIMLSFTDDSLKKICSIIDNGLTNYNQDIIIKEIFIKRSDYDSFMGNQTHERIQGNTISVTSSINRLNFSCKLSEIKNDPSVLTLVISTIRLRLDSVKPIFAEDIVAFEYVSATVLGECFLVGGNQS